MSSRLLKSTINSLKSMILLCTYDWLLVKNWLNINVHTEAHLFSLPMTACSTGCFFNWPPPEFAKCWPVSNWFKKNVRVPDWPPLWSENACLSKWMWFHHFESLGGRPVEAFFGGGQSRGGGGGAVKKNTLYDKLWGPSQRVVTLFYYS